MKIIYAASVYVKITRMSVTIIAIYSRDIESSRVWTFVVGAELAIQSQQRRWDDGTRHPQLQPALSSAGTAGSRDGDPGGCGEQTSGS